MNALISVHFQNKTFNSSHPGQNDRHFADDIIDAFSWMKSFVFWLKFHWSLFQLKYPSVGLDNGLASNRLQAIIWTSANPIHWRLYAVPVGDELSFTMV